MSTTLVYQIDDFTEVAVLLEGLESAAPDPTTTPAGAHYFATDTGRFLICTGLIWKPAVTSANPGDATTGAEGFVLVQTAPGGAHPEALGLTDLSAHNGATALDGSGLIQSGQYPIADATHLGMAKVGVGLQADSSGVVSVIPGGVGDFGVEHNDASVGTEPQLNFVDGSIGRWTVTDDPAGTRAKISANADPILNFVDAVLTTDLTITHNTRQTVLSVALPAGTWWVWVQGLFRANATSFVEYQVDVTDGTTDYGTIFFTNTEVAVSMRLFSKPIALASTTTILFRCYFPSGGVDATALAHTPTNNAPNATHMLAWKIAA